MSGGHFADEEVVELGFGVEGAVEVGDEGFEVGAFFGVEEDGAGEMGVGFALRSEGTPGRERALGVAAVGSGGGLLFFRAGLGGFIGVFVSVSG